MNRAQSSAGGPVVLLTGAAGFLGRAIVHELLKGAPLRPREIRAFDLNADRLAGQEGVVPIRGDVRSLASLREACRGVDLVLHAAALIDWGRQPDELLEAVNVGGTRNVLQACRDAGVRALVHTSTLDVVYGGKPVREGDESLPYPPLHVNGYCRTKAAAERLVLEADGQPLAGTGGGEPDGRRLRTLVLRPCAIWGEGDPYHLGALARVAERGALVRVGRGEGRSQHVYVRNAAHAHAVAGRALLEGKGAGQVYFITVNGRMDQRLTNRTRPSPPR